MSKFFPLRLNPFETGGNIENSRVASLDSGLIYLDAFLAHLDDVKMKKKKKRSTYIVTVGRKLSPQQFFSRQKLLSSILILPVYVLLCFSLSNLPGSLDDADK